MIYHSTHLFIAAKRAYQRSIDDRTEAMPAIVLATIAFECFINEITYDVSSELWRKPIKVFMHAAAWLELFESKHLSTLEKIEVLHFSLSGTKIDRGAQPYQDLSLLYWIRDQLIHRKPEGVGAWHPGDGDGEHEPHKFVKVLTARGIIEMSSANAPPAWSQIVLNENTARWAFNTAVSGVRLIVELLPTSPLREIYDFKFQDTQPEA